MMIRSLLLSMASAACLLTAAPALAQSQMQLLSAGLAKTDTATLNTSLDAALKAYEKSDSFSGVVLLAKGDQVLFQNAYGQANRDFAVKNTVETRFNLASASKMFTAVAILQLMEQGKLKLDDPVGKYIDESWIKSPAGRSATVAQLLSHTGGFGSYFSPEFDAIPARNLKTLESFKPLVVNDSLQGAPGQQWGYSNTGYLLLGVIIEKASGVSYDEYLKRNIFQPLGMKDTGAFDLEQVNPLVAVGYDRISKLPQTPPPAPPPPPPSAGQAAPPPVLPSLADLARQMTAVAEGTGKAGFSWRNNIFRHVVKGGPAGGMYSTAPDMLRFLNGLEGGKLVSADTVKLMTSPKPQAPHWGYGLQLEQGAWGHTGGFIGISDAVFALPDGYRMIVLSNTSAGSFAPISAIFETAK